MDPRRILPLPLALLAACSFHVVDVGSNSPDSGVQCPTDAGPGAGSLIGPGAFQVRTAREKLTEVADNDSGIVSSRSLLIGLLEAPTPCGQEPLNGATMVLSLYAQSGVYGVGDYVVGGKNLAAFCVCTLGPDGGPGAVVGLTHRDDAGSNSMIATGGVVRLTAVSPCSVSGTFALTFELPDGGDGGGLSGTFDPVYCR